MEEELEVLKAIYCDELKDPDHTGWHSIRISGPLVKHDFENINNDPISDIWFYFLLHPSYPDHTIPSFRIEASNFSEEEIQKIMDYIKRELFIENESCMFSIISWLMEELQNFLDLIPYEQKVK